VRNRFLKPELTLLAAFAWALAVAAGPEIAAAQDGEASVNGSLLEPLETPPNRKPRVVITADPELDDSNSLVRYLVYSADYATEGLIYASSQFHWKGDGKGTKLLVPGREYTRFGLNLCPCESWRWDSDERFIDDAVNAYAEAYPNLRVHDPDYPTPEQLRAKIRWGNVEFDGEMAKDTEGSDLIESLLLDDDESPVYLHAWGGQSTIARALKSIEEQYAGTPQWAAIRAIVIRKAVIHPSGDQDDTYANYIEPVWPEIRYRRQAGGASLSYNAQARVSEQDAAYFTTEWTRANVSARGALGALYRVWGDGKQMVKGDIFDYFGAAGKSAEELKAEGYVVWTPIHEQGSFLGEGDTPTFLNLVDNGLRGYRSESFGGWGGHAQTAPAQSFAQGFAALESFAANPAARQVPRAPTHPFLAAAQRDFAARLVWATTPTFAAANHAPRLTARGSRLVSARRGDVVELRVRSSDPDGDDVAVRWWRWDDADSYAGSVELDRTSGSRASFAVPGDAEAGQTIHVVAEATDDGSPALTRYERFVVSVTR
jgi:hypothetical protein